MSAILLSYIKRMFEMRETDLKKTAAACLLGVCVLAAGCRSSQTPQVSPSGNVATMRPAGSVGIASPHVYIYKMKGDYSQLVPVVMDKSRTRIVSYPAPSDLKVGGRLVTPTPLDNGYWLDNRGINEHVAFLDYTYEEYSALEQTPTVQQLEARILERYPLTELYVCGKRGSYADEVTELNALIKDGFPGCRKVELPRDMSRVSAPKL